MATLSFKPSERYRLSDWRTNSYLLSTNAERQRDASHQIRQEARILRNETNNQIVWDEHDNRTRLAERIDTVNRWKETLDKCLTDLDAEIDSLAQAKESAEQNLQAKNLPLDVAIECLTLRESRRDIDVVRDPVEEELLKEVEVIEATKKVLQEKISQAFQHLCSTTLQQWDEFTRFNKNRAEAEMKASIELREAIALAIAQTNNELDAQRVATEFTFRKRLREMESFYSELKWQEKNTLEEIAELQGDIRRLEEDLRRKMMNLKLAHTRLESRTYRSNVELCRDQTQYGLIDEVHQLEATINTMKQKLAQTQNALDALFKHLARIQADIACKTNTLLLDTKCMDTRRKLTVPAEKFVPQVDTFTRTTNRTLSPLKICQLELT